MPTGNGKEEEPMNRIRLHVPREGIICARVARVGFVHLLWYDIWDIA